MEMTDKLKEEEREKEQLESEVEQLVAKEQSLGVYKESLERYEKYIEELKEEKKALEVIVDKFGQDNSKTAKMYYEKDAEIDFLQ